MNSESIKTSPINVLIISLVSIEQCIGSQIVSKFHCLTESTLLKVLYFVHFSFKNRVKLVEKWHLSI